MKTKSEQSELEKRINALNIFKVIENLKKELSKYQQIELIKHERYTVKMALIELEKNTDNLKSKLEEVIQQAKNWEGLE